MPSPIAHAAVGVAVHRLYRNRAANDSDRQPSFAGSLIFALVFSLMPDLDFVPGLLLGDLGRYHNTVSTSIFTGMAVALAVAAAAWFVRRHQVLYWASLALICYELHVIMDYFTIGRGVMLFWPLSTERFQAPAKLFYGLHRSDGLVSVRHIWTLISELLFVAILFVGPRFLKRFRAIDDSH